MSNQNLADNIFAAKSIEANVVNDDTDGTGVGFDCSPFTEVLAIVDVGVSGDTLSGSVKFQPTLQESDSLASGYTAVDSSDYYTPAWATAFGLVDDPAEDAVLMAAVYKGDKKYIRVLDDTTGTHTAGTPVSAIFIGFRPRSAPKAS